MKKRLIGILLTMVVATQVFPIGRLVAWSNLIQFNGQDMTANLIILEDEEVEEIQFKVKQMESNHSMYLEGQIASIILLPNYPIITHLGKVIDRNNPILIPPPNPTA